MLGNVERSFSNCMFMHLQIVTYIAIRTFLQVKGQNKWIFVLYFIELLYLCSQN